ncbi:MAG: DUF480 domain-containing protein [Planctomycetia bacterium]|nr:DUF480 domain-containing protein [Planctomycetia bacterium]
MIVRRNGISPTESEKKEITMDEMEKNTDAATEPKAPREPLTAIDRRILGVLVEKSRTVPDSYPMSLNAIVTASNQKSNRSPQMNLDEVQVDDALSRLRKLGAVILVQGIGRVEKYRHQLHEWLGVDRMELAVVAELFLRGTQMVGELRSRVSRMESFPDQATLQEVLKSLEEKGLVKSLTPSGRGQIITHAFWLPQEAEKVTREAGRLAATDGGSGTTQGTGDPSSSRSSPTIEPVQSTDIREIREEIQSLRTRMDQMAGMIERLESGFNQLKRDLGD